MNGQGGNGALAGLQRLQHAMDDAGIDEGTGAVMDQNHVRGIVGQGLEAEAHGLLTGGAAVDRRIEAQAGGRGLVAVAVVGVNHGAHLGDVGVGGEQAERMAQQRTAVQLHPLLGQVTPETVAPASGHNQRHDTRHYDFLIY